MSNGRTQHVSSRKLLAVMVLRVVLVLLFLGVITWFQFAAASGTYAFAPIYATAGTVGFLTLLYVWLVKRLKRLRSLAYAQITIDVALVTFLVYLTGGIASYLSVLYYLFVIAASIVLSRAGGLFAAFLSGVAYSLLLYFDFTGVMSDTLRILLPEAVLWQDLVTTLVTNVFGFFVVAYLTGYLAERTASVEKELEEKEIDIERLENFNKLIIENIHSGIMTLDNDGRITSFNKAAEEISGYSQKEASLKEADELFKGIEGGFAATDGEGLRCEDTFFVKGDDRRYLGFSISEAKEPGLSRIVIFQDLTKLHSMEEQLRRDEKLKALGELSAGIAHEIRNPLASISGSIEVLRGELDLVGDDSHLMEIVLRETERLNALISDFLVFARPDDEKRELLNVTSLISETLRVFGNSPEARGLSIDSELTDGVFVAASPRQIRQVIWNFFINAAQAMDGTGVLKVSLSHHAPEESGGGNGMALISVADTGKGMGGEEMERIFDPFYSTKASGTGLGLAIAHRIIESHGGSIGLESSKDHGTTFTIRLPKASDGVSGGRRDVV